MYKSLHIDKGAKSVTDAGFASLCINLEVVVDEANSHQHAENKPKLLEKLKTKFVNLQQICLFRCCIEIYETVITLATKTGAISGT